MSRRCVRVAAVFLAASAALGACSSDTAADLQSSADQAKDNLDAAVDDLANGLDTAADDAADEAPDMMDEVINATGDAVMLPEDPCTLLPVSTLEPLLGSGELETMNSGDTCLYTPAGDPSAAPVVLSLLNAVSADLQRQVAEERGATVNDIEVSGHSGYEAAGVVANYDGVEIGVVYKNLLLQFSYPGDDLGITDQVVDTVLGNLE